MSTSIQQEKMPIVTTSNCDEHNSIMPSSQEVQNRACKKVVRYKECLKNHAAALGGKATDGCGEFIPSGDDGTPDTLKCSACNCHRNFHRKEIECDCSCSCEFHNYVIASSKDELNTLESDEKNDEDDPTSVGRKRGEQGKKRFRTKFTQEQKGKMISFAEKAGWKIQMLNESMIEEFCQEIGIKRRVLKVWMHNNKHKYAKSKSNS